LQGSHVQVGVKYYVYNIVAWKLQNIQFAIAQQAQLSYNLKNIKEKLLKTN